MANILLITTGDNSLVPTSQDDHDRICESVQLDKIGKHQLVYEARQADIILFIGSLESDFWDVRCHPLVDRYPQKCFLYHGEDFVFPFLPGVYPSLKARDDYLSRACSCGYTAVLHIALEPTPFKSDCRYLFSFRGSFKTHPIRGGLARFANYPRAFVIDTSIALAGSPGGAHAPGLHRRHYADLLADSKFVLCPRGRGPSSWRLFEALKAGRVPVIISDDWVPPPIDENWSAFSVRVKEKDIGRIPTILKRYEQRAEEMAALAREVYEQWFSREVFFHRTVEWCLNLKAQRRVDERYGRYLALVPLIRPGNFRRYVLPRLKRLLLNMASLANSRAVG